MTMHRTFRHVYFILSRIMLTTLALKAEWISLSTSKIDPRRSGHTSFIMNQKPFVFGGYIEQDGDDDMTREVINDLWQYNKGWTRVPTKGDSPGPRLVSASGVIGDKAFLFGGWDPETAGTGGVILDDVYCLNNNMEWEKMPVLFPDGPTSRHVAVSLNDDKILLHNHRCLDHVYVFDCSKFQTQPTTGISPGSVGLHAACLSSDNNDHVVIFGGATQDGSMSNQCHVLNTKTWEWKLISTSGSSSPCPRAGACLVPCGNHQVLLFGGAEATPSGLEPKNDVWILDWKRNTWNKLDCSGPSPEPRNAATLTVMPTSAESSQDHQFLLTGGWAP
eukprot:CAMPEP_0194222288 /NCGR_PEP_ID=MMETSP0156-20130528/32563_1 /TAXON_ID=33649 /ORGANISM="Thalassionema nitzschioides, Strain L26-B" /LENGTH=332 /DNA_ID=CAMNT_0038953011 /DNA_START=140 /DNA_END=1135 /DNA_ORIENTATION=-